MNYYIAVGSEQRGPFAKEQLLGQGLRPETMVWADGMAQWERADLVADLMGLFVPAAATSYAAPAASAPNQGYAQPTGAVQNPMAYSSVGHPDMRSAASTKLAAGLCGILIGGLGIHKFILGNTTAGIIQIVISVCTCGLGGLIGLIEGIIYLTKTDEEFYQIYMVQKKSWF